MRLVFFGAGSFGIPALQALAATHDICRVICPPPRPAGRKMHMTSSPLASAAKQLALPLQEEATTATALRQLNAKTMVVCDYGVLLPPAMWQHMPRGALNIHPSLLPRWRGAAPITRALLAGDAETGVSIMQMDAGLDTGEVILQEKMLLPPTVTGGTLAEKLSAMSARLLLAALKDNPPPIPQNSQTATFAAKIHSGERALDCRLAAAVLERQVRAFAPVPAAYLWLAGERIKIHAAQVADVAAAPGSVLSDDGGIVITCGEKALSLLQLQRPGRRTVTAAEFQRGFRLPATCEYPPQIRHN